MRRLLTAALTVLVCVPALLAPITAFAAGQTPTAPGKLITDNPPTVEWKDRTTIIVYGGGSQFTSQDPGVFKDQDLDSKWHFAYKGSCRDSLVGVSDGASSGTYSPMDPGYFDNGNFTEFTGNKGYLLLNKKRATTQQSFCDIVYGYTSSGDVTQDSNSGAFIKIDKTERKRINFYFNNSGATPDSYGTTIDRVDVNSSWRFTVNKDDLAKPVNQREYLRANDDDCKDKLNFTSTWSLDGATYLRGLIKQYTVDNGKCVHTGNDIDVFMGNDATAPSPPDGSSASQSGVQQESTSLEDSCESQGGLAWIICPVITLLDKAVKELDDQIQSLLTTPSPKEDPNLHQAWGRIRNIALILLVPIMLVMVIGTALDFSFIDAYTVRRAMPRFLIAIIFISLSWEICSFLVTLTNVVGAGILGIMTQPFDGAQSLAQIVSVQGSAALTGALAGGIFLGILGGALGFGVLLSLAFTAALALLIGFIVLLLRQLLILALVIFAPLAILAWIFPGNDKFWKLWWGTFTKLLLMFPLIMILIGSGKAFASILANSAAYSGIDDAVIKIMAVIAYIIPYFFIPLTFRAAGGIFGTVTGMINDRSKGIFDRQKQKRAEMRKETRERAGMNRRFNPTGRLRGLNAISAAVADPMNTARIGFNTERGRALKSELTQKAAAQSQDLAKWMSQAGFNQEALTEIMAESAKHPTGRLTHEGIEAASKRLKARAAEKEARGESGAQDIAGANQLLNSAPFLEDTWRSEEFGRAHIGMAAGLAKASQGFLNNTGDAGETAKYATALNGVAAGLGDTFKTQAGLMNAQAGGLSKVGYSEQTDANGNIIEGGTAARSIQMSRTSVQEMAGAKASALKAHFIGEGKALDQILEAGYNGNPTEIRDEVSGEVIDVTEGRKAALLDTVAQAAYGYNTPAETAQVLREKLDSIAGGARAVRVDGGGVNYVNEDGSAASALQVMAIQARTKASRDPREFGGLDAPPPAPAE